jgi:hypothetical protein
MGQERAARTQIIDGEANRLGWRWDAEVAATPTNGCGLKEGAGDAAVVGGQDRVADNL